MSHPAQPEDAATRARAWLDRFYGPLESSTSLSRRVGWESDVAHRWRLGAIAEALAPVTELDSVLDAGCGEGRLLEVLHAAGFRGAYRGEELREAPVLRARTHAWPDGLRERPIFEVADAFADGATAEVVVCSGSLNSREGQAPSPGASVDASHERRVAGAVRTLWRRARHTLAVDLAIFDRHAGGVGLGRVRMGFAMELFRGLGGTLRVFEDGPPGEALFIVARDRRRTLPRALPTASDRLEALLGAGDADAALWQLAQPELSETPPAAAALARGRAHAAREDLLSAEAELLPLLAGQGDPEEVSLYAPHAAVALALAPVLWRLGQREQAVAVMRRGLDEAEGGVQRSECRYHLGLMLASLGREDEATQVRAGIEDPWIRRALEPDP